MSENIEVRNKSVQILSNIATFELSPECTTLYVQENCDYHFETDLTANDVAKLITGLQALHRQMK